MKTIGIKLADGTFYPILEEGTPKKRMLDLTTAKDNQTKVQIDLYRSETGSMDDAEYVDTLEVTKLVPHPNGEPELHLSLGLDEDNNLSAEVVDPETGKKSETEVNLVSKTMAEKASPADFAPSLKNGADENNGVNGLLDGGEDYSFDDLADDTLAEEEEKNSAFAPEDLPEIKSDALENMPFSFGDSEPSHEDDSDRTLADSSDTQEPSSDFEDADDFGIADNTLEGMNFGTIDSASDKTVADENSGVVAEDFDLPDFDTDEFSPQTADAEPSKNSNDTISADTTGLDFADLPDFDDDEFKAESALSSKPSASESDIDTAFDTSSLDDFDTSDLDASLDSLGSSSSSENSENGFASGSAMDFSDLYDKETMNGEHASIYDEDNGKKTRVPVVICIICAIICVLATILVLFIVPSKYNLIKSRNTRYMEKTEISQSEKSAVAELPDDSAKNAESASPVDESPVQIVVTEKETEAEPAVEDKVVVAKEPEKVVPAPAPKAEKKPDVKYHIRWGDTLWDLSDSYYKTPWKYQKIANYNHIKNPDLIISGTDILIPSE